jgi:hypothetical protein
MSKPQKKPITADKPGIMHQALKRPDRPAAIAEKLVKDEVISLPTEEEPLSDDAAFPQPLSSKPSIPVANNTEPEQSLAEQKPKKIISIDSVPKSNTEPNDDPLISTQIEVTPPWGGKTVVNIVDSYIAPSGDKWVSFMPIEEIPSGWTWEGGVKKLSTLSL